MRARYRESESLVNDLRREFGEDLGRTLGGPWEDLGSLGKISGKDQQTTVELTPYIITYFPSPL
jgi:predicted NUDIX family NTP pyrophosphohydrolase